MAMEELLAALRPVEVLTKNLCMQHFTTLQADTVFQTAFSILRSQQTHIADRLLAALETRYKQRKNINLLSTIRFLMDPVGYEYEPGRDLLDFPDLQVQVSF